MLLTMRQRWADDDLVDWNHMNDPSRAGDKTYRVYLLRLWRAEAPDSSWRASLEYSHTGERIGFEGLEQLFAYLMEQTECDTDRKQGGQDGNHRTSRSTD